MKRRINQSKCQREQSNSFIAGPIAEKWEKKNNWDIKIFGNMSNKICTYTFLWPFKLELSEVAY
jgi:hypothetical protein